jgi:integrase
MPASTPESSPSSTHGLTVEDLARVAAATEAARAPSTRYVYALQWRAWQRWCATRDLDPLPADPAGVAAYLADRTASGLTVASVDLTCSAIRDAHLAAGLANPTDHPIVRRVRDGLRRTYGTAPQRQARALSVTELGQILARIDRTTPTGARDAAILLLGYAGALRRSDLAALDLADIKSRSAGLLVTIRRSKTDQDRRGQVIGIAHGQHRATDPVAALDAWLGFRGRDHGPVFTRVYRTRVHETGLAAHTIGTIIRDRAAASGLSADRITSHSLRAGHATAAALAGVPLDRIAAQTRHRSLNVLLDRYIRPLEAAADLAPIGVGEHGRQGWRSGPDQGPRTRRNSQCRRLVRVGVVGHRQLRVQRRIGVVG